MYRQPLRGWIKHLDFILIDLLSLQLGFLLSFLIRFGAKSNPYYDPYYRNLVIVLSLLDVLAAVLFNTYSNVLANSAKRQLYVNFKHAFLFYAFTAIYLFVTQTGDEYSRVFITMTVGIQFAVSYGGTLLYRRIRRKHRFTRRKMVVISTRGEARAAVENIWKDKNGNIDIVGAAIMDADMAGEAISDVPVIANWQTVEDAIQRKWVDEVYVRIPQGTEHMEGLLDNLRKMGFTVHLDLTAGLAQDGTQVALEKLGEKFVLTVGMKLVPLWKLMLKRAVDILGGLAGCIIAGIIALLIGPLILKESPGPLLFAQERIGRNGRRFKMYKFRSMYLDAEERKQELMAENRVKGGLMFKLDWDPRIIGNKEMPDGTRKTGIGAKMRQYSLDEFAQFINVLIGNMSLVGTRPPTPDEWEKYGLYHRARLSVKPGITGLWQVSGRSEITDFDEVVRLDTEYIENWSLGLDLRILIKTVGVVLGKKGAM